MGFSVVDGNGGTDQQTVKPASTAAVAGDKPAVITIHPSTASLPVTGTFATDANLDEKFGDLGQKAMVGSTPVVIASDQTAVPVSGTVTANLGTIAGIVTDANLDEKFGDLGQKAMGGSAPVTLASDQSALPVTGTFFQATQPVSIAATASTTTLLAATAATATLTNVASSATTVSLLGSQATRKGASFFNDSTANLFLKLGATASLTSFTVKIFPGELYELPVPSFTGAIDGIWDAANGAVRITELT